MRADRKKASRMRSIPFRVASVALLIVGVLTLGAPPTAQAQGGPGAQPPAQPPGQPADPALAWGAKFFDDAIRYVARGKAAMPVVRDFYTKLDAKLELDTSRQEGQMRLWFLTPDHYRQELTTNGATTTKILARDAGWIRTPNGRVQNLAISAEGQASITQLKEDRDRIADLTQFLTLQALKGPGVNFRYMGTTSGSGTYAGDWIKVVREAPGRAKITFWLAYTGTGQNMTATFPGIVRVDGDPAKGYPTEDYILKEWDSPRSQQQREFRYPRQIEAYSLLRGPDGRPAPTRFLWAIVEDIKINAGIDQSRFGPN